MAWVESAKSELLWINGNNVLRRHDFNASFAVPLLLLGESNCESYLVLRHFCEDSYSGIRTGYRTLIQTLLRQLFRQRPEMVKSKAALLTRDRVDDMEGLWSFFVDCLREIQVQCIFIVIDSIDFLETKGSIVNNGTDEGLFILEQLNELVNDSTLLIKILLTAALAREAPVSAEGLLALTAYQPASRTQPQRKMSFDIMQNNLALVPHKLVEIQENRCKSITFAELPLLYPTGSTIYTTEESQLRAYVVAELVDIDPRPLGSYEQLRIGAWSIDHNGKYFTKRYHNLLVSQYPGKKAVSSLKYVPTSYLLNEAKERRNLIERGKLYWNYGSDIQYVYYMVDTVCCQAFQLI